MEHSKNYNKIQYYYYEGLWNIEQVRGVVDASPQPNEELITPTEFYEITGEVYSLPEYSAPTLLPPVSDSDNGNTVMIENGRWEVRTYV